MSFSWGQTTHVCLSRTCRRTESSSNSPAISTCPGSLGRLMAKRHFSHFTTRDRRGFVAPHKSGPDAAPRLIAITRRALRSAALRPAGSGLPAERSGAMNAQRTRRHRKGHVAISQRDTIVRSRRSVGRLLC